MDILNAKQLEQAATILKTIAHPLRIGIVNLLQKGKKLTVSEICEQMKSEQSLTSHHLANMKSKGVLDCEREGKNIYYYLKIKEVTKVLQCVENCQLA